MSIEITLSRKECLILQDALEELIDSIDNDAIEEDQYDGLYEIEDIENLIDHIDDADNDDEDDDCECVCHEDEDTEESK